MASKPNIQPCKMSRIVFNEPYQSEGLEPQQIKEDAHQLFSITPHDELVKLFSTYFNSDQLVQLIDDRLMGRV